MAPLLVLYQRYRSVVAEEWIVGSFETKTFAYAAVLGALLLAHRRRWVAGHGSVALVLLFALFPSTASAVGCIVTAGRRDLYLSFLIPLIVVSASTLLLADDSRLRGLGVLAVFFGMALLVLHHVISRNTVASIRLQWRSERLLRDLAHERSELTGVNDQLGSTNMRLAHQATHDPLTGLYNRRGTLELLDQVMANADEGNPVPLQI